VCAELAVLAGVFLFSHKYAIFKNFLFSKWFLYCKNTKNNLHLHRASRAPFEGRQPS
jgi:hypothetical protein